MIEENDAPTDAEVLSQGRKRYLQLAIAEMLLVGLLLLEEILAWHAPGFVIAQTVAFLSAGLLLWRVGKTGGLRWLMFMVLLLCGALGFLYGGLHLTDPAIEAVDPLCYWLSGAGFAIVGMACYLLYSSEVDAFLKHQRSLKA